MPFIGSENELAHPKIENIFKSKKQREIDDVLRLASCNGQNEHQKFRNPGTTTKHSHNP